MNIVKRVIKLSSHAGGPRANAANPRCSVFLSLLCLFVGALACILAIADDAQHPILVVGSPA
jgi:hypothetical protein